MEELNLLKKELERSLAYGQINREYSGAQEGTPIPVVNTGFIHGGAYNMAKYQRILKESAEKLIQKGCD